MFIFFVGFKPLHQTYYAVGIVFNVIQPCKEIPEGYVAFKDTNGNEWGFYGSEDWFEGDTIRATIDDNGTVGYVGDDEILETIYTGWIY